MLQLATLDGRTTIRAQTAETAQPAVLVNLFTVPDGHDGAMLETWRRDASFMQAQPGFISAQLHRGLGTTGTFLKYAVWEDVAAFAAAFGQPDFQRQLSGYPPGTVARPMLFAKVAVPGICPG